MVARQGDHVQKSGTHPGSLWWQARDIPLSLQAPNNIIKCQRFGLVESLTSYSDRSDILSERLCYLFFVYIDLFEDFLRP